MGVGDGVVVGSAVGEGDGVAVLGRAIAPVVCRELSGVGVGVETAVASSRIQPTKTKHISKNAVQLRRVIAPIL